MFGQLNSVELRTGLTLAGIIAFRMLGLFMILPVFMLLAADMPGFSPAKAGLAVGIYGLTQALLQQPFGKLSDRFGRRPVMLVGLALFAAGGVVLYIILWIAIPVDPDYERAFLAVSLRLGLFVGPVSGRRWPGNSATGRSREAQTWTKFTASPGCTMP